MDKLPPKLWSHDQDRVWAQSHWSKRVEPDKSINWNLEVRTEEHKRLMGELVIVGTIEGNLGLSISMEDE